MRSASRISYVGGAGGAFGLRTRRRCSSPKRMRSAEASWRAPIATAALAKSRCVALAAAARNVVGAVCCWYKGGLSQSALGKSGSVGGWRRVRERNERSPLSGDFPEEPRSCRTFAGTARSRRREWAATISKRSACLISGRFGLLRFQGRTDSAGKARRALFRIAARMREPESPTTPTPCCGDTRVSRNVRGNDSKSATTRAA